MLPEYAALPGSEPSMIHDAAAEQAAARFRPKSWRALGAAGLAASLFVAVLCTADNKIVRRAASSLSLALAERDNSQPAFSPSPLAPSEDAVESAIATAHDALRRQRYSMTDPYAAHLPLEVAENVNFSTDPCSNFYEYACGQWVAQNVIPADRASLSRTWDGTEETVFKQLQQIVTREWPEDSPFRRLNEWYQACMDVDTLEAGAGAPLQPMLARIDALQTVDELRALLVEFFAGFEHGPKPFVWDIQLSIRDKDHRSMFLKASGLTMPDPGWYGLNTTKVSEHDDMTSTQYSNDHIQAGRQQVLQYFQTLNELSGSSPDEAALVADQTLAFETMLAQWRVDEPQILNPMGPELTNLTDLKSLCPGVPWAEIFEKISDSCSEFGYTCNQELLADQNLIIMTAPYFFSQLSTALTNETMLNSSWKPYLRTHYIGMNARLLSKDFVKVSASLEMWASGQEQIESREMKCSEETRASLAALTSMAYLDTYFANETKTQAWSMLSHIKESFIEMLSSVDWMDEETRKSALEKMDKLGMNMGGSSEYKMLVYPVSNESYYNNSHWSRYCRTIRNMMELGADPHSNTSTWSLPAYTVNAWYDNGLNALFIPAGILQPPFFSNEVGGHANACRLRRPVHVLAECIFAAFADACSYSALSARAPA
jgi:putative endopeptidase